ncbi:hypothetical protein HK101_007183 [Irineochytrium annulatum]|nr:hypothetical protein HK101_007183 [Irineochytrium annulatum]
MSDENNKEESAPPAVANGTPEVLPAAEHVAAPVVPIVPVAAPDPASIVAPAAPAPVEPVVEAPMSAPVPVVEAKEAKPEVQPEAAPVQAPAAIAVTPPAEDAVVVEKKLPEPAVQVVDSAPAPVQPKPVVKEVKAANKDEEKKLDITEHLMSFEELMAFHHTSFNSAKPGESKGLTSEEAARRLQEYGPNMLTPPKKRNAFLRFCDILFGLFNLMLIIAGVAAYIVLAIDYQNNKQNAYLGGIVIFVAFMNATIEFYQVQKSQAILESFLNLIPANCYVLRDGKIEQISAKELVVGDVVQIRMGDKVPADVILFASTDMKVDNSSLTGEAEPQERHNRNSHETPLEATNLVFNGTLCVNGDGFGVVIRTGDNTVIGQIASLTTGEQRRESPMSMEIEHFVYTIAGVAAIVAIVFFIVSMTAKANSFAVSLNFAIGTFVAFVPEGLPATVTMLLTIAAKRMSTRQVLVKDLQGVETLGAITLLATDKTGTLTRNQMTLTYVWSGLQLYYAQNLAVGAVESENAIPLDLTKEGPNEVIHISSLCCKAKFKSTDVPIAEREIIGDATEAGLIRCAATKLDNFDGLHDKYPKVFEIPFNSENKWAMTIHKKQHKNGPLMLYIKGAPERILKLCNTVFDGTDAVPLTPEHAAKFDETYTYMASKGHRVLAFAALALPEKTYPADFVFEKEPANYPTKDFTFYGLVSLEDPPKHGVREAVGKCRAAGIKVMMVTGDHPLTAEAIGRKINLMLQDTKALVAKKRGVPEDQVPESDVHAIVIHGERIDKLTDADWDNIFSKDEIIFARTSPKHKLQIVKRAQGRGHIVGVTGDGVNDSPALKKADLGIAMNISGSDVSKEAAAMILLDDNFASSVSGIEEGRLIFQNLKKSIQYTVTHTMPEVYANLLYIAVPLPLPLNAVQILVVDLGFELFMALSYAYDPSENPTGLMKLQPRKPVNPESVERLNKRKQLDREERDAERKAKGLAAIEEGHDDDHHEEPSKVQSFVRGCKKLVSKRYWKESFEKTDEQTLVDGDLLCYSYLEAGTIMSIGCFASYFFAIWYHYGLTPTDLQQNAGSWFGSSNPQPFTAHGQLYSVDAQSDALAYGQSAFYLALMIQQCFNLFICKARLTLPFGRFMFANLYSFVGLFCGCAFTMAIVYIPPLNVAFQTQCHLTPLAWVVALGSGILLYVYSIIRGVVKRALSPIKYSDEIIGLQMFPTRFSTGR